jgi:hypothetical protein
MSSPPHRSMSSLTHAIPEISGSSHSSKYTRGGRAGRVGRAAIAASSASNCSASCSPAAGSHRPPC